MLWEVAGALMQTIEKLEQLLKAIAPDQTIVRHIAAWLRLGALLESWFASGLGSQTLSVSKPRRALGGPVISGRGIWPFLAGLAALR